MIYNGIRSEFNLHAMGEVSQTLAHELNQPLTAILVNAEAALRLLDDGQLDLQEVGEALGDLVADHKRARTICPEGLAFLKKPLEEGNLLAAVRSTFET